MKVPAAAIFRTCADREGDHTGRAPFTHSDPRYFPIGGAQLVKVLFYCQHVLGIGHLVRRVLHYPATSRTPVIRAPNLPVWKVALEPVTTEARP